MWLDGASGGLYAYTGGRDFVARRPTIVLLHGAQCDHSVWILQSRYLAHRGWPVLAFDLPGHGRSAGPAAARVEDCAARVAAALAALDTGPLLVAGHSMGGLVALQLASELARPPAQRAAGAADVAGIALVASAFPMRVSDALLAATRADPPAAMRMINVWSHSAALAPFAARPGNPGPGFNIVMQNLRLMERIALRNGPGVLATDFQACADYAGGFDAARALRCPALFVLGGADSMTPPRSARALIEACADATVENLPQSGHALMSEDPEGVRRALERFAARVFGAGASV